MRIPIFWMGVIVALPVSLLVALVHGWLEYYYQRSSFVLPGILVINVALSVLTLAYGAWWVTNQFESARDADDSILHQFGRALSDAGTLPAVATQIVAFYHQIVPQATITLKVFDDKTLRLETQAMCTIQGQVTVKPDLVVATKVEGQIDDGSAQEGESAHRKKDSNRTGLFEIALIRQHQQVGCIELEYPARHPILPDQMRICNQAETLCTLAIENTLLEKVAAEQASEGYRLRQQLGQNLHDTLAQNISFLKLKVEELSIRLTVNPEVTLKDLPQQLSLMRATAEEAYQQVRSTIDYLNPMPTGDLRLSLFKQAKTISERAGFVLRTTQIGSPYALPSATSQHILYIAREAMHNIEKHAQATRVNVQLIWLEQQLIMKVVDNGIGFDPQQAQSDGHYGLWIMRHRASEIGGTLKFSKGEDGCGAEVTLWVPRSAEAN